MRRAHAPRSTGRTRSSRNTIVPPPSLRAVQVFLRNEGNEEADVVGDPDEGAEGSDSPIERPVLTTEFDVFGCDSFVEDSGKWLRLMPDLGYVPT